MIESISAAQLQAHLGVEPDDGGLPNWAGVTALLRQALARWGLSRAGTLTRHVQATLSACGYEGATTAERVREALALLCVLGDAEVVWADSPPPTPNRAELEPGEQEEALEAPRFTAVQGRLIAPSLPRAVDFGERFLVSGSLEVTIGYQRWGANGDESAAARWLPRTAEEALEDGGFEVLSPVRWLGASGLLDHLERRSATVHSIEGLWPALMSAFDGVGGPVADQDRVAVIGGSPGRYWGRPADYDGRWCRLASAPDGLFLGVMLGHHGGRTQPIIGERRGGAARVMELYDLEELRWAVLSRSRCEGTPEVARLRDGALQLTCPLPAESLRLRALCATSGWTWTPPPFVDPRRVAEAASERFGLSLE